MSASYNYTRIRPVDLLQVATDQGSDTTISAAISSIQSHSNLTKVCPKCQDNQGNPTGWNIISITGASTTVICTVCVGFLKTQQTYMPDPNRQGEYKALVISGPSSVVVNQTAPFMASVSGGQWASSDTSKATINAQSGVAIGVAAGSTVITYTVGGYSTIVQLSVSIG